MSEYLEPTRQVTDSEFEEKLRPAMLGEFVGQAALKEKLSVYVEAAKRRGTDGEALDHVLFYGPPGLGKTTLAHIIANEMGSEFRASAGPVLERPGDLVGLLTSLGKADVISVSYTHLTLPTKRIV